VGRTQHYVPQFLLRGFAHDGSKRATSSHDLETGQYRPTVSIRKQCARPYLYGRDELMETALSELESMAAAACARMLRLGRPPHPRWSRAEAHDWSTLTTFLMVQSTRTPRAARLMTDWMTRGYRAVHQVRSQIRGEPPSVAATNGRMWHPRPEVESRGWNETGAADRSAQSNPTLEEAADTGIPHGRPQRAP